VADWPHAETVAERFGVGQADLQLHSKRVGAAKAVAIELCCCLSGHTQRDLARPFGYKSESAIGKQRQNLMAQIKQDASLARKVKQLRRNIQ
jgi:chromosomal replication initiation ATPase DnaA